MVAFVITVILIVSFILALRELKELTPPPELVKLAQKVEKTKKEVWGVILFFKDKVVHYSSNSSIVSESDKGDSSSSPAKPG